MFLNEHVVLAFNIFVLWWYEMLSWFVCVWYLVLCSCGFGCAMSEFCRSVLCCVVLCCVVLWYVVLWWCEGMLCCYVSCVMCVHTTFSVCDDLNSTGQQVPVWLLWSWDYADIHWQTHSERLAIINWKRSLFTFHVQLDTNNSWIEWT
jgi:hypothetical protein